MGWVANLVAVMLAIVYPPFRVLPQTKPLTTKPTTAPAPGESDLIYRTYQITMVPTPESQKLGAAQREDLLSLQAGRVTSSRYIGGGCVVGSHSQIVLNRVSVADNCTTFTLKAHVWKDPDSTVEWHGSIRGGDIGGEVVVKTPGTPTPPDRIDRALSDLWETKYKPREIVINGRIANDEYLRRDFQDEAEGLREQMSHQGNTIRYRFRGRLSHVDVESPRKKTRLP